MLLKISLNYDLASSTFDLAIIIKSYNLICTTEFFFCLFCRGFLFCFVFCFFFFFFLLISFGVSASNVQCTSIKNVGFDIVFS